LFVDVTSPFIDDGIVPEYKKEITNTHFIMAPNGKLLIEPKEDIKLRIGRSPDPADALMLACLRRAEEDDPKIRVKTLSGVTKEEEHQNNDNEHGQQGKENGAFVPKILL
jgi:hypothetical protein